jgi:hypothetical protein
MTTMVELKPKLHDLLMREAHLRLSREQLKPVWAEKEAELRAVQTARPLFLPVFAKRKRAEYEDRLAAAQNAVSLLRTGMDAIDRIEPHLKKLIEGEIEESLREESPEYVHALAARRQKEDWARCVDRFAEKIHDFTRALGNVRNHACSGYGRLANTYSQATQHAFTLAVEAAQAVEEEVKFANKVADAQARMYIENGFNLRPLPHLTEPDYTKWVKRINDLPLAEAQMQFDILIEQTKKLFETGVPELRAQADRVDEMQAIEIHNFLVAVWERYRAEIAPEIFAGDTPQIVAETETMLLTKGRASVRGRL